MNGIGDNSNGSSHINSSCGPTSGCPSNQDTFLEGTSTWSSHAAKDGRIYYCNHVTRTAGWLPPSEEWFSKNHDNMLPYGWEEAIDSHGKPYFINHLNKTTTYEVPAFESHTFEEAPALEPRYVKLIRSVSSGFGFVAGSEKPVIVRFVTENGPSVNKLLPGDEILRVNGENVKEAPREKVISMIRASDTSVDLMVCQPSPGNEKTTTGRKSTLLSPRKRAQLKAKPSRVRFAESVCVNGAPLFPPSAFSMGENGASPMANVLKVFLENGQTKSFKYDANTTVQDVVSSLQSKLCLCAMEHFSLVVEHIKSLRRNKLTLLDPQDTLTRIASRPGAHRLRCLFRVSFVPVNLSRLAQRDPVALDYLFAQCCNDVTTERFAPELQPEAALRLAALHMYQHAIVNNISASKLTVKIIEREFGLERFIAPSLLEKMKRKEIRRSISHFLRSYSTLGNGASSQNNGGKPLSVLQSKLLYLDLVSQLPSYGAKCFTAGPPRIATPTDCLERVLLVSPRFGLSQIAAGYNNVPIPIVRLEDIKEIEVKRDDHVNSTVKVIISSDQSLLVSLEERDANELSLVIQGYHKVLTNKLLPIEREYEPPPEDTPPLYLAQHTVIPVKWTYLNYQNLDPQRAIFLSLPTYHPNSTHNPLPEFNDYEVKRNFKTLDLSPNVDKNMNNQIPNQNQSKPNYDFLFKDSLVEAKNEEVMRRVHEMNQLVENSEQYLTEQLSNGHWQETNLDVESDSDSQMSGIDSAGALRHSDSLTLLTQAHEPQFDLSALTDVLYSESDSESFITPNNSPLHYTNGKIRTSFGLHSPDNIYKDQYLPDYLKQLRIQLDDDDNNDSLDETDIIDLTLLPPPQTPDELDDLTHLPITVPPSSFADDSPALKTLDLDKFLASVAIQPPAEQMTPAVELTPEEIVSYIIPPPPAASVFTSALDISSFTLPKFIESNISEPKLEFREEVVRPQVRPRIHYATLDRKSTFSCCGMGKQDKCDGNEDDFQLPPRNCVENIKPPDRPPKPVNSIVRQRSNSLNYGKKSPMLPPRDASTNLTTINQAPNIPPHLLLPPKKPPLIPVPAIELRNKTKPTPNPKIRTAGIGSPHLQRSEYKNIENEIESPQIVTLFLRDDKPLSKVADSRKAISTPTSPHLGRNSKLSTVAIEGCDLNNSKNVKDTYTIHKNLNNGHKEVQECTHKYQTYKSPSEVNYSHTRSNSESRASRGGFHGGFRFRESMLSKSDVALAGLLVRLDQVAAQCSDAQARGGGRQMCEAQFQVARQELTSQSLQLVTSSKCVVVSLANPNSADLPEHLASCLTIFRRLIELSQDLSTHTTAPLQTRNIILKVHNVTASFRDLIVATINTSPQKLEEKLAFHAECLANVLATLLRSLRVFSP